MVTNWTLQNDYYSYINAITNVFLTLNSAINFLIYCLVGKKFRRIFVVMICSGRGGVRCWRGEGDGGENGAGGGEEDEPAAVAGVDGDVDLSSRPGVMGDDRGTPGELAPTTGRFDV